MWMPLADLPGAVRERQVGGAGDGGSRANGTPLFRGAVIPPVRELAGQSGRYIGEGMMYLPS